MRPCVSFATPSFNVTVTGSHRPPHHMYLALVAMEYASYYIHASNKPKKLYAEQTQMPLRQGINLFSLRTSELFEHHGQL